jgi:hypothetical protein
MNVYQADPSVNGLGFLKPQLVAQKLGQLQPMNTFSADTQPAEFKSRAADVYGCFLTSLMGTLGNSCFGNRLFGIAFGDLFLFHEDQLIRYLNGGADYQVPVFLYNSTSAGSAGGLLGFADDNWSNGTQSFIFGFLNPDTRSLGYGLTTTATHEVGHHLGMSHPHDGYDSTIGVDYGPGDEFFYAWAGDESHSIMSYLDLSNAFGQFDRDNMGRYLTAVYINQANRILAAILSSPRAGAVSSTLNAADTDASAALVSYAAMNYTTAATQAKLAYTTVLAAAGQINVHIEPQAWQADYKSKGKSAKFIDFANGHRNLP